MTAKCYYEIKAFFVEKSKNELNYEANLQFNKKFH